MRVARLRALTRENCTPTIFPEIQVEMRVARLRAFSPIGYGGYVALPKQERAGMK